jgi:hypothetical protein
MAPTLSSPGPPISSATRIAFDIELANIIELAPGEDLERHAPFDIACAAAADAQGGLWHWFCRDVSSAPTGWLDAQLARDMLRWLREHQERGVEVCAWNGLSFDLRWLGHVADDMPLARAVALDLIDPMFQFFCQRGFPVGLAKVADAMGIPEAKLMKGEDAPKRWAAGEHQLVLDYVAGDCRITEAVVGRIQAEGAVRWRTQRGTISSEPMRTLLPVHALLDSPLPDTSWMSEPLPRAKFMAWLEE